MVRKYCTRTIELEAIQYHGDADKDAIRRFIGGTVRSVPTTAQNVFGIMPPSSGTLYLYPGDYLMRLPNRTLKVWKASDFAVVFERIIPTDAEVK
jgi:hypothetical protein